MKAMVNTMLCQGYANCIVEAPEVFVFNDDSGQAEVVLAEVPPELLDEARTAAKSCPVSAISLQE